jgi:hypothetical protein
MKPKEKAKELVNKYWTLCYDKHDINKLTKEDAKECALIAVDEILKITCESYDIDHINWWKEVKQEIIAL